MAGVTGTHTPLDPDTLTALRNLADLCGVATSYTGQNGEPVQVSPAAIVAALRALGLDLPADPAAVNISLCATAAASHTHSRLSRVVDPTVVATENQAMTFPAHVPGGKNLRITVEPEDDVTGTPAPKVTCRHVDSIPDEVTTSQGTAFHTRYFELPELPVGTYGLWVSVSRRKKQRVSTVLVAPAMLSTAKRFAEAPATGVMAQLYSVRDEGSWGIGDYGTLATLGHSLEELGGADFILVNPMHAAEPFPPVEDSPYLPTTRRYTNPLYLQIDALPEFAAADDTLRARIRELAAPLQQRNSTADLLERGDTLAAKMQACAWLFGAGLTNDRERELEEFISQEGEGLQGFVSWAAGQLPQDFLDHARATGVTDVQRFLAWVQLACQQQEATTQAELETTMRIGLMADLAVGVHPAGSDATSLRDVLATDTSVGAPPDGYNQQGQDWSQPPWHPWKLAEAGFTPWRDMLRTILRSTGGIRIDHILGLFRLWWIPRGHAPTEGTYVSYDYEALVAVLLIEAERAGAVVVGEDLGTFEPWVQEYLASRGIMGTSILWFEGDTEGPKQPGDYRTLCLSSVNTHDLPPSTSYLRGGHIELREELGVLTKDAAEEYEADAAWQAKVQKVVNATVCPKTSVDLVGLAAGREDSPEDVVESGVLQRLHQFLSLTPSALRCVSLVDMVGDVRAQNQPGTTQDLYPNWRVPLCDWRGKPVSAEGVATYDLAREVLAAARGE